MSLLHFYFLTWIYYNYRPTIVVRGGIMSVATKTISINNWVKVFKLNCVLDYRIN